MNLNPIYSHELNFKEIECDGKVVFYGDQFQLPKYFTPEDYGVWSFTKECENQ